MGIQNINPFLRKFAPRAFEVVHINRFAHKKVAVDISLFLYKYKVIHGASWVQGIFKMMVFLRRHKVHPIVIFDGEPPAEKIQEQEARRELRKLRVRRYEMLTEHYATYMNTGEMSSELTEFYDRQILRRKMSTSSSRSSRNRSRQSQTEDNDSDDMAVDPIFMKDRIDNIKKQVVRIDAGDIETVQAMMDTLCIPYVQAKHEAEGMCAWLTKHDIVDAVMTEDTDVLAYGAKQTINRLNTVTGMCTLISYNTILNQLLMTDSQFTDLCVMCGCDYNSNVKGLGSARSYQLLVKHKTIEGIEAHAKGKHDFSCLNHVRVRELFSTAPLEAIPYADLIKQSWCRSPKYVDIVRFMRKHNCMQIHPEIVFNVCSSNKQCRPMNMQSAPYKFRRTPTHAVM